MVNGVTFSESSELQTPLYVSPPGPPHSEIIRYVVFTNIIDGVMDTAEFHSMALVINDAQAST